MSVIVFTGDVRVFTRMTHVRDGFSVVTGRVGGLARMVGDTPATPLGMMPWATACWLSLRLCLHLSP